MRTRIVCALFATGILFCAGCAGITAVNIPSIGYFDFDSPPVTADDKHLMYLALVDAASQRMIGARSEWFNPDTEHNGIYEVTKVHTFLPLGESFSPYGPPPLPAAEVAEIIRAGGQEFQTQGIGVYFNHGRWYRYK